MYNVLNKLSEYTYFYICETLLHSLLLFVFKIVESLQCILILNGCKLSGFHKSINSVKVDGKKIIPKKVIFSIDECYQYFFVFHALLTLRSILGSLKDNPGIEF